MQRTLFDVQHELFRQSFRRFLDKEIVPHHLDWERAGITSRDVFTTAGAHGFLDLAVIDRAMQTHGAMGFTQELSLAEAWQMIRVICVADGTSEILRRQVAAQLLKGDTAL